VTTKDLIKGRRDLCRNLPCWPSGYRAPRELAARAWELCVAVPLRSRDAAARGLLPASPRYKSLADEV
jgi:hypothetical protein